MPMSTASVEEFFDPQPDFPLGRGGVRRGAGRKPKAEAAPPEAGEELTPYQRYERARAEKEEQLARQARVKADLDEQKVVDRQAVRDATAQAFAAISQSLDAIPDILERDGVAIDVAQRVGDLIAEAKSQLANDLEQVYEEHA
jgi:hypothetical protein